MAKEKFYYDSNTLSYRKVKRKKGRTFTYFMLFFSAAALVGFFSYVVISSYIESPQEKVLKRENEDLKFKYEYLNKRVKLAESVMQNLAERDENIYRVHFEANSVSAAQRKAGFGGVNRYENENSELIKATSISVDKLIKEIEVQSRSLDEIEKLASNKEALLEAIPAIQPIQNKDLTRVASGYGMRMHPILKYRKMHNGMDFTASTGTPIYATGDGVVIKASRATGFGNVVYVDHGFGYETRYAHMSKFNTKKDVK